MLKEKTTIKIFIRKILIIFIFFALFCITFLTVAAPSMLFGYDKTKRDESLQAKEEYAAATPITCEAMTPTNKMQNHVSANNKKHIAFEEHFNNEELDSSMWNIVSTSSVPNNELQKYRPSCISVCDGNLVITAKESSSGDYFSGMLDTKGKLELTAGRIDIRMKLCSGKGFFPAAWLQCSLNDSNTYFEIDIMENLGDNPDTVYGVVHIQGQDKKRFYSEFDVNDSLEYHIYSVEWDTKQIQWLVDGFEYYSVNVDTQPLPMYLVLNLAVGGDWPGAPESNTVFPSSIYIDFVRIYAEEENVIWH